MSNLPFEFGKALPDQVTPERLQQARSRIAHLVEVDPGSIHESVRLAEQLQGVSRAISDIVLARGAVEVETVGLALSPNFDPPTMPITTPSNTLRRSVDPSNRFGITFIAQPSKGYGASLSLSEPAPAGPIVTRRIVVPTDQLIDHLLMQEPPSWREESIYAEDLRNDQPVTTYPFSYEFYKKDAPTNYFGILQGLSRELLAASE